MTGTELATLIRKRTKTDSTTFPSADMLVDVNIFKDEIAGMIQQRRPEIFNMPAKDDLVANQREYSFPSDVMNNIVSLNLKFDSSNAYVWAEPFHAANRFRVGLQESEIVKYYNNNDPYYFIRRNAIYILSGTISAVTDGILLVYNAFPANLADLTGNTDLSVDPTTTSHGFPREFHELLARRVSIEYKDRNDVKLSKKELDYDDDLIEALDNFSTANLDEEILSAVPTGTDQGDDGFDY